MADSAAADAPVDNSGREATGRNSVTVVVWTLLSRVAGLVRVLVIGALMGPTLLRQHLPGRLRAAEHDPLHHRRPDLAMVLIPTIVRALDAGGTELAKGKLAKIGGRILGVGPAVPCCSCCSHPWWPGRSPPACRSRCDTALGS